MTAVHKARHRDGNWETVPCYVGVNHRSKNKKCSQSGQLATDSQNSHHSWPWPQRCSSRSTRSPAFALAPADTLLFVPRTLSGQASQTACSHRLLPRDHSSLSAVHTPHLAGEVEGCVWLTSLPTRHCRDLLQWEIKNHLSIAYGAVTIWSAGVGCTHSFLLVKE